MSNFNGQRAWREPGVYLYKLTRIPFNSARLPNGIYTLRVTATDIRGNHSSSGQVFIVRDGGACEAPAVDHRECVRYLGRSGLAAGGSGRLSPRLGIATSTPTRR